MKKGEKTRAHILDKAADFIANKGIKKLTARSLAKAADVSPALIIHYFPNLEDLMYLVISHIFDSAPLILKTTNPDDQIEDLIRRNFDHFEAHPNYYKCILLSYFYAFHDRRFRDFHLKNVKSVRRRIVGILQSYARANDLKASRGQLQSSANSIIDIVEGGLLITTLTAQDLSAAKKRILTASQAVVARLV